MRAQTGALAENLGKPTSAQSAGGPALPLVLQLAYFQLTVGESLLGSFVHSFIATHLSIATHWIFVEEKMHP